MWVQVLTTVCCAFITVALYTYFQTPRVPYWQVRGKHFFITGGSSGIGFHIAYLLAKHSAASVTIVARNPEKLSKAHQALEELESSTKIVSHVCDVGDYRSVEEAVEYCVENNTSIGRRIDCIICCAGITYPEHFENIPMETFESMTNINYLGSVRVTKAALKYIARGPHEPEGRIIYVSSLAGMLGVYGYSCYAPTKYAVRGLAETLYLEFIKKNIRISVCAPPDTDTESYAIENKTKPAITHTISGDAGLFTPQQVASSVIDGLHNYTFYITTGFDGYLLASIISGFSPATFIHSLFQVLFLSPLRALALWYLSSYRSIVHSTSIDVHEVRNS